MLIKKIQTWSKDLALTRPYTIAFETFNSVENIFVLIELDEGIAGIGAGAPSAFVTGETMASAQTALLQLEGILLGADIRKFNLLLRQMEQLFPNNPAVRAAVDIALHDAYTKMLGIPLIDYWGRAHKSLPTSITIGIKSLSESLAEALEYISMGFKVLKVKTGKNVEEDIVLIQQLRATVPSDIRIRVDANQGYQRSELLNFYKKTKHLAVELIEQPFLAEEEAMMLQIPSPIRQICMADESLKNPSHALHLAQTPQPFGLYNIKLMKCGGLAAGHQIASIAHLGGIGLMWGCMDESIVSITAALHLALACPATKYLDLDGSLDLAKDVVTGGFVLENGEMWVREKAGLGVGSKELL